MQVPNPPDNIELTPLLKEPEGTIFNNPFPEPKQSNSLY